MQMTTAVYGAQIWQKRHFWLSLVRADLHARYRRSVLGMGWSLLQPISMTAVLCVVFATLFSEPIASFAPYVLSGMALWTYLATATTDGCMSFYRNEAYIRQQPAPLAIYPLRATLSALVHFLLAWGVLVAFVAALRLAGFETAGPSVAAAGPPPHQISFLTGLILTIPVLALTFVLGWALAICAGLVTVMFQDTQHLVQIGLQITFYATPVFYREDVLQAKGFGWLIDYNPAAAFLHLIREPLLNGRLPAIAPLLFAIGTTLAASMLALWGLKKMERRLVFFL